MRHTLCVDDMKINGAFSRLLVDQILEIRLYMCRRRQEKERNDGTNWGTYGAADGDGLPAGGAAATGIV